MVLVAVGFRLQHMGAHVCCDRYETRVLRKIKRAQDLVSFRVRGLYARHVESVVDGPHFLRRHTFANELLPHVFAIGDHGMGHAIRRAFDKPLRFGTDRRFPARRDSHRHARETCRSHAENVRVEVVRVYDVDLVLLQELRETTKLTSSVKIVKAVETKLGNVAQAESIDFIEQHTVAVEGRDKHVAACALQQQSRKLHCLSFGTALVKTADEL